MQPKPTSPASRRWWTTPLVDTQRALSFHSEARFLPWQWMLIFIVVSILDYVTGPFVHSAILFYFIPIGLAAWSGQLWWALALATIGPPLRLGMQIQWGVVTPWTLTIDDMLLNWITSMVFAGLVWHLVQQERKLRVLQGMLPICSFCKRIRNGSEWQPMEQYITDHSEAKFSHSYCPECGKKHYPQYFG